MHITCMAPSLDTFWLHSIIFCPPAGTRRKGWEGMAHGAIASKMIPGPTPCSPIHIFSLLDGWSPTAAPNIKLYACIGTNPHSTPLCHLVTASRDPAHSSAKAPGCTKASLLFKEGLPYSTRYHAPPHSHAQDNFEHICPATIRASRHVTGQPTDHTWSIALAHTREKDTQTKTNE